MNINDELDILDICFQFAYGNSRSRHDGDEKIARVVYFDKLVEHLYERDEELFWAMREEHGNLLTYLKNKGRYNIRTYANRNWNAWNYEIMPIHRYDNDLRHAHNYFTPLYEARHELDTDLVFAALPQKQAGESDNLINAYQNARINGNTLKTRVEIRDRIKSILTALFPNAPLFIEIIGSTMTGLGNTESDLNLCIRVSRAYLQQYVEAYNYRMVDLRNSPKTIFNMRYIAMELRKQTKLRYIKAYINSHQPFVNFFDDKSTTPCTLSLDYGLGLETGRLIAEYVRLDKRVGPFIYCIKKFARCQGIDSYDDGFLSSYGYTILGLHFLMAVLLRPVIPCLQEYDGPCHARNCYSRLDNEHMVFQKSGSLDTGFDCSFHTCLEIKNNLTDKYTPTRERKFFSVWESNNNLHLISLLEHFFTYFKDASKFKNVSIITQGGQLVKTKKNNIWSGDCVVIQDPFFIKKNIGKKCLETSLEDITEKFGRAGQMLHDGLSFSEVCFS
ncbi:uncharacterized protein EV154DRAFT_571342 [Mucor mucedo]|uniref:uncharacterized protein n=1 Tax=Mucor mucedo TaxID=29922 RepID=UPI00221FB97B|nr:uncharacterized protein EV154DRAFT_571342 [Mucor mucedo]KAI7868666.1 hypothetical protein EV154DRAFT_571342 [Mucor mucedo]